MFTYEMLAEKIVALAEIDWKGREDQRNTCKYGLEMLIAFFVNCIVLFLIGIISNRLKEIIIYIIAWGSLRLFAGGKHAKNHFNCIAIFTIVMLLEIHCSKYLAMHEKANLFIIVFMAVGLIINAFFAGSHRANKQEARQKKKTTLKIWCIQFVIVCFFLVMNLFDNAYYLIIFSGAVLIESLFLVPIKNVKIKP